MIATASSTAAPSRPEPAAAGRATAASPLQAALQAAFSALLDTAAGDATPAAPASTTGRAETTSADPATSPEAATAPSAADAASAPLLQQIALAQASAVASHPTATSPGSTPIGADAAPAIASALASPRSPATADVAGQGPATTAFDSTESALPAAMLDALVKSVVDAPAAAPVADSALAPSAAPLADLRNAVPAISTSAAGLPAAATDTRIVASPLAPVVIHADDAPQQWGAQIEWTLKAGVQEARIEVSPGHLGPVEVHVQSEASRVHLAFSAAQAETRQLLNEQLPRLREALAAAGLQLGDAQVGQQQARPSSRLPVPPRRTTAAAEEGSETLAIAARVQRWNSRGLLDRYA